MIVRLTHYQVADVLDQNKSDYIPISNCLFIQYDSRLGLCLGFSCMVMLGLVIWLRLELGYIGG